MARGEVAVITGSTSGIGLGLAEGFAAAGYRLAVNGFAAPGEPDALVERLRHRYSVEVIYHPADLADPAQCEALVRDTESRFGAVNVLVNNAGIQHVAPIESFPVEQWDRILAVNLSAAFHTTRAALPAMQRRGAGRIVNIASVHGLVASIHKAAYVAAKHGLVGLTRVAALENAARGITCNAICPGFVLTPLVQAQIDARAAEKGISAEEATEELLREKQPSGRFTTVEEIAAMALFLCSPAAANMNGACLPIDGAWTAQ
ncbi:MAG TPA: 3-hydroxybutyrate dehydrogenase [Acidobacteriaceae bacterium]|nr:3-hydroxybutyrate dehydrogenase [Acidobacteriaceae bacterium]